MSSPPLILQGKYDFVKFRKGGKPVARATSVVLILVDFAKIHLKRNAISTICDFCSRDVQVPDTEQGNSCIFWDAPIGIMCTERKKLKWRYVLKGISQIPRMSLPGNGLWLVVFHLFLKSAKSSLR